MVAGKIFVESVMNYFKSEGFDFSHISQMNITIIANKKGLDVSFLHESYYAYD